MTRRRTRDIRADRQAKDLARWMGWDTPMPGEAEPDDQVDEPVPDHRVPIGPLDVQQPGESAHG